METGENIKLEMNSLEILSYEKKNVISERIKAVVTPLSEVLDLRKKAHEEGRLHAKHYPMKLPITKNKVAGFFFTAFHYALFLLGAGAPLSDDTFFRGAPYKWYAHLYMWITGKGHEYWVSRHGDSFLAQTITVAALLVLPFIMGFVWLWFFRVLKRNLKYHKQKRISTKHLKKERKLLKLVEEKEKEIDTSGLNFIPYRYHSATCLSWILNYLESGEALRMQDAYTKCEWRLREQYGDSYVIPSQNCNVVCTYVKGKEYKDYI